MRVSFVQGTVNPGTSGGATGFTPDAGYGFTGSPAWDVAGFTITKPAGGFGAIGPTVLLYDDFRNGVAGQSFGTGTVTPVFGTAVWEGQATNPSNLPSCIYGPSNRAGTGPCMRILDTTDTVPTPKQENIKFGQETTGAYVFFACNTHGTDLGGMTVSTWNFKMLWLQENEQPAFSFNIWLPAMNGLSPGQVGFGGNDSPPLPNYGTGTGTAQRYDNLNWTSCEAAYVGDPTNPTGSTTAAAALLTTYSPRHTGGGNLLPNTVPLFSSTPGTAGSRASMNSLRVPGLIQSYPAGMAVDYADFLVHIGENALCRFFISDSGNWATSTTIMPCTITGWSDTQVSMIPRRGGFPPSLQNSGLHLYQSDRLNNITHIGVFGNGFLPTGHYVNSVVPLSIIAPRAGLASSYRYYKAYPGIQYRVPVSARGGAWPYVYTLTSAPTGMTVGQAFGSQDYGIINWLNPVAGTYTVTVQVQDQLAVTISVTWTLTVTTAGFIFFDAVNGNHSVPNGGTGDGSIGNPFKDLNDWWWGAAGSSGTQASRKADTTYQNFICYYKSGTYTTASCASTEAGNTGNSIGGIRVPMVANFKPKTHLAYPGQSPVFDVTGGYMHIYADNGLMWWMHGITSTGVNNVSDQKFIAQDAGGTDVMLFENTFGAQSGTTSNNPTVFMILANNPPATFVSIINNNYQGLSNAEAVEFYDTLHTLVHGNTVSNSSEGNGGGFYFKQGCADMSVRANTGLVGNSTCLFRYDNMDTVTTQGTVAEVCWNNYKTTGPAVLFGTFGNNWGNTAFFRNTWQCTHCDIDALSGTGSGTIAVNADVTIGDGTQTNNWSVTAYSGSLTFTNYTTGTAASNIVDTNGNLLGTFRTSLLGLAGHEIA